MSGIVPPASTHATALIDDRAWLIRKGSSLLLNTPKSLDEMLNLSIRLFPVADFLITHPFATKYHSLKMLHSSAPLNR